MKNHRQTHVFLCLLLYSAKLLLMYHEASQDTQKLWLVCVAIGWWLVLVPGGPGAWRMGLVAASDAPCSIASMNA